MKIKVLVLDCVLKKIPQASDAESAIRRVEKLFNELGADTETVSLADYRIYFGISSYEVKKDEWYKILLKIKECDVLVLCYQLLAGRPSAAQLVIERLNEIYSEAEQKAGRFPLYGKVGGVIITGEEWLARSVSASTILTLSNLGCIIPPSFDSYRNGNSAHVSSYTEAGVIKKRWDSEALSYMINNLFYFAKLLKENPVPPALRDRITEVRKKPADKP